MSLVLSLIKKHNGKINFGFHSIRSMKNHKMKEIVIQLQIHAQALRHRIQIQKQHHRLHRNITQNMDIKRFIHSS